MSALAVTPAIQYAGHQHSELVATQQISRLAASGQSHEEAIDSIFSLVLTLRGVWRIAIEGQSQLVGSTILRVGPAPQAPWGSVIAAVEAGLYTWGQLRICFEFSSEIANSPVRFANYVAQQIAALLDRAALRMFSDVLRLQASALDRRLKTKKAVARAIGLLTSNLDLTPEAARAQIVGTARRRRRSLLLVAQSVIFLQGEDGNIQSPAFHRLLATKLTTTSLPHTTNRTGARV